MRLRGVPACNDKAVHTNGRMSLARVQTEQYEGTTVPVDKSFKISPISGGQDSRDG